MVAYSFKRRFVTRIQVGLGQIEHIPGTEYVPKRQTIRAVGKRRHARPGEAIQLYSGMRTKKCFKIGEARCVSVEPIRVYVCGSCLQINNDRSHNIVDHELDKFARADGFSGWKEMQEFWAKEHGGKQIGPFNGLLIKWEPLNG